MIDLNDRRSICILCFRPIYRCVRQDIVNLLSKGSGTALKEIKPHSYDPESWEDEDDPTTFQPLRKQSSGSASPKADRRQRDKEWGRAMHKYHKQRGRNGKP